MQRSFLIHTILIATFSTFGSANAQQGPRQAENLGPSDAPVYTERVRGSDGRTYNCKPGTTVRAGVASRLCVAATQQAAGAALAVGALAVLGASDGDMDIFEAQTQGGNGGGGIDTGNTIGSTIFFGDLDSITTTLVISTVGVVSGTTTGTQ